MLQSYLVDDNGICLVKENPLNDQLAAISVGINKEGKIIAAVHPIKEGGWQGNNWIVLSGLNEGDQVIADNLIKVRPGAPVNPHPFGAEAPAANAAPAK